MQKISELEDKTIENFQTRTQRKIKKKNEQSISEPWDIFKSHNIHVIRTEVMYLKKKMAYNFPDLMQTVTHRSKKLKIAQAEETWRQLHKAYYNQIA